MNEEEPEPRVRRRAEHLLPEESKAGSDDPHGQAERLLAESDAREAGAAPDSLLERRTSEQTVDPPARPELPDPDKVPDPPEPPD